MTAYIQHLHVMLLGSLVFLSATIAYYDIRYFRIPNVATFLLAASGLICATGSLGQSLMIAIANGFAGLAALAAVRWLYSVFRKQTGLGMGDVKLAGAACIWIGILQLPWLILVACIVAFTHICVLYITTKNNVRLATKLPFGAHLAVALCYLVLVGMPFDLDTLP
ncbi:A24 family peptidase [Anderseniella sp. Alg231-50]|uniref:A24 family peptidase n=1 Tax=Anderseniella sp. Alg231-50 TaxID=1922226 RepID=UPI00307B19B9